MLSKFYLQTGIILQFSTEIIHVITNNYLTDFDIFFATLTVCLMLKRCMVTASDTDSPAMCQPHTWQSSLAYVLVESCQMLWF